MPVIMDSTEAVPLTAEGKRLVAFVEALPINEEIAMQALSDIATLDAARAADPGGCRHDAKWIEDFTSWVIRAHVARTADPGGLLALLDDIDPAWPYGQGLGNMPTVSEAFEAGVAATKAAILAVSPAAPERTVRCSIPACNGEHSPDHPHVAPERTGLDEAAEAIGRDVLAMFNATTNGERNRALERALAGLRALTSAPTTDSFDRIRAALSEPGS